MYDRRGRGLRSEIGDLDSEMEERSLPLLIHTHHLPGPIGHKDRRRGDRHFSERSGRHCQRNALLGSRAATGADQGRAGRECRSFLGENSGSLGCDSGGMNSASRYPVGNDFAKDQHVLHFAESI
eukprot:979904-Prorocentrum_minimum.AAC.3